MTRVKNRGKPSVSGSVAKELKRYVSAAVAPREEHRKLSFPLSLFPLLDAEEKDFLILYISCSHFASSRLGSPSLFFFFFSFLPPPSLFLSSILYYPFRSSFGSSTPCQVIARPSSSSLNPSPPSDYFAFPSLGVPPQRYDQINVTIDPSVPLLPRLAPSFHPLSTSFLYQRLVHSPTRVILLRS